MSGALLKHRSLVCSLRHWGAFSETAANSTNRWRDDCDEVQTRPEAVALCLQNSSRHRRVVPHSFFSLHLRGFRIHDARVSSLREMGAIVAVVKMVPRVCIRVGTSGLVLRSWYLGLGTSGLYLGS